MSRGRHRAEPNKIIWKFVWRYYQNRWWTEWKPSLRKFLRG